MESEPVERIGGLGRASPSSIKMGGTGSSPPGSEEGGDIECCVSRPTERKLVTSKPTGGD